MGFDIELTWREGTDDPVIRNRRLADFLLAGFPDLEEFPLDVALISQSLGVQESDVWNHWNQIELNATDAGHWVQICLWLDRAIVVLPSNPPEGCRAELNRIRPLLSSLESHGLQRIHPDDMLQEYEAQQARVLQVAKIVDGYT